MAQKISAIKIASTTLNTLSSCNRFLHDGGAAVATNLHNTESVVGLVADSLGRSKCKLTGEADNKIGPNADLLKQLPKSGDISGYPPVETREESSNCTLPDPNMSMWNMCKETNELARKKLLMKFRKLKDNIKNYYLKRLEENQILFTEIEEPFIIGKLERKERVAKYRECREDEIESLVEEVQPPMRPARRERMNLMSQSQSQNQNQSQATADEVEEEKSLKERVPEEVMQEPQPQKVGYRQFNRSDYKLKSQSNENTEQNTEAKTHRVMSKAALSDMARNERFSEPDTAIPRKISQIKSDKIKEERAGGLSDIRGMSPAIYFKVSGLGAMLNSKFHLKEKINLLKRPFSICMKHNIDDRGCKPSLLPPKEMVCEPKVKLLPKETHKWPCCPRITLCGCEPPNPRVYKLCDKEDYTALFPFAKRPDYICPAFSECKRQTELVQKKLSECCWFKNRCDSFVGPRKPFVTALERQEISLGHNYWTGKKTSKCGYHTSASLFAEDSEDCGKEKKGLPCHKPARGSQINETGAQAKGSCDKLCMPCCKPARIPPICESSFQKPPCTKIDNPRPSFSECKKAFAMKNVMCECEVPIKPKCPEKKIKDETC